MVLAKGGLTSQSLDEASFAYREKEWARGVRQRVRNRGQKIGDTERGWHTVY